MPQVKNVQYVILAPTMINLAKPHAQNAQWEHTIQIQALIPHLIAFRVLLDITPMNLANHNALLVLKVISATPLVHMNANHVQMGLMLLRKHPLLVINVNQERIAWEVIYFIETPDSCSGQDECTPCPEGSANDRSGASSCTPCLEGFQAVGEGNTACAV